MLCYRCRVNKVRSTNNPKRDRVTTLLLKHFSRCHKLEKTFVFQKPSGECYYYFIFGLWLMAEIG